MYLPSFESAPLFLLPSGPPTPSERFSLIDMPDMQDILYPLSRPPFTPSRSRRSGLLPKLWDVLTTPSRHERRKMGWPTLDADGNLLPLGGEEGELVEDEGCYDVVIQQPLMGKLDIISNVPSEVALQIFRILDLPSVLAAAVVSRLWYRFASDKTVWRQLFYRQLRWKVDPMLAPRKRISSRVSARVPASLYARWSRTSFHSAFSSVPSLELPTANLELDWLGLYKSRLEIDRRWLGAEPKMQRIAGHMDR